eukprot:3924783-Amphidinium_carterae.1
MLKKENTWYNCCCCCCCSRAVVVLSGESLVYVLAPGPPQHVIRKRVHYFVEVAYVVRVRRGPQDLDHLAGAAPCEVTHLTYQCCLGDRWCKGHAGSRKA